MIAKIESSSILLATRASPVVLAMLPQIEGRRHWLKGGGLKLEDTPHNRDVVGRSLPEVTWDCESDGVVEIFDVEVAPSEFKFKRKPDPHQSEALARMHGKQFFGLFMEQGTGKTKVAIDRACQLFVVGHITAVLVVTKKGVHRQWVESELPKDCNSEFVGSWWSRKTTDLSALKAQGETLKWFAVNYDALRSEKAMEALIEFCSSHSGKLLIIADESQCIKSHSSTRHKRMFELRSHSSHRMLLTGTPIAKDLTDEWAQLKWLDERILGVKYITTFRAQYCIMGGYEGRAVVGQKNMDDFRRKVDPWTYRVTKKQIGYIPKRHKDWVFDLLPEQKRMIQQVKQELIAELADGSEIPISSATAAFTKVQQISNGFILDEERELRLVVPVERNPRANALLELLEADEGKFVIWTRFIADRQIIGQALRKAGIKFVEYCGTDQERHSAKQAFLEDESVRCFLANPQSAGTGLDGLQTVCSQAVYYSNSFNAIDRWQSEDRIDRRGMIGGSIYTDLIAKGSIDRHILRNLSKKKGISSISLGDIDEFFSEF